MVLTIAASWLIIDLRTTSTRELYENHPIGWTAHPNHNFRYVVRTFSNATDVQALDRLARLSRQGLHEGLTKEPWWTLAGVSTVAMDTATQYDNEPDLSIIGEALAATYVVDAVLQQNDDRLSLALTLSNTHSLTEERKYRYPLEDFSDASAHTLGELAARDLLIAANGVMSNKALLSQTRNLEAIRLLKHGWAARDPETKRRYFRQAIGADPGFVRPYIALANWSDSIEESENAIFDALAHGAGRLDGTWQAAAGLSFNRMRYNEALNRIEKCFDVRAINWWCHNLKGQIELRRGQLQQASDTLANAATFWTGFHLWRGHGLRAVRRYEEAIASYEDVIRLDHYRWVQFRLGLVMDGRINKAETLWEMGQTDAANQYVDDSIAFFERENDKDWVRAGLAYVCGKLGRVDEVQQILKKMLTYQADGNQVEPIAFAKLHLGLGNTETALDYIEEGLQISPFTTAEFMRTPIYFAELENHPRYIRLLEKLSALESV